eukprot:3861946-Amphidinium_carterae.1
MGLYRSFLITEASSPSNQSEGNKTIRRSASNNPCQSALHDSNDLKAAMGKAIECMNLYEVFLLHIVSSEGSLKLEPDSTQHCIDVRSSPPKASTIKMKTQQLLYLFADYVASVPV